MQKMKLKCITCGKEYSAKEIRYNCDCGDLLEVIIDFSLFNRTSEEWKQYFDNRKDKFAFLRYKDFLLPDLPEDKIITLGEGDTPLYQANEKVQDYFGVKDLWFKHEGMSPPTLSFKDRGMVAGVSWANYLGIKKVACASTGDTSAAMSAYAANSKTIEAIVLLPEGKISFEQLAQAISYNATTIGLKTDFDGCMKLVKDLTAKHKIYLLNSMNSIRIEGQKAIGIEVVQKLKWDVPDWFIIPVGNAGNISALGKGLRELFDLGIITKIPRIAGVETEAAPPLYKSFINNWAELKPIKAKKTIASAIQIGNPVSFKKAVRELKYFNGVMEQVSETELMDAKTIVDASGISVCPNSGTALAGLKKLVKKGTIKPNEKVVVIITAHGAKFSKSIQEYHENKENKFANQPKIINANLNSIEKIIGEKK